MRDTEIYQGPEHWPQPADEKPTLSPSGSAALPLKRKSRKNTSRTRKKMSESFSGAAVTVVAAATLLGALPEVPELAQIVEVPEPLPICTLCGREGCAYYNGDVDPAAPYGLRLTGDWEISYTGEDDIRTMSGFSTNDLRGDIPVGCVCTETGQRVVVTLAEGFHRQLPVTHSFPVYIYPEGDSFRETSAGHVIAHLEEPGSMEFILAAVTHSPTGQMPDILAAAAEQFYPDVVFPTDGVRRAALPIEGVPNTWLQVITNAEHLDAEALMDLVLTTVLEEPYSGCPLGDTMILTESPYAARNYGDYMYGGTYYSCTLERGTYTMFLDFAAKEYHLHNDFHDYFTIRFAGESWNELLEQWQLLNEDAAAYGHESIFPLVRLEDVLCNGIVYRVYAATTAEVSFMFNSHWTDLYLVPQQEPDIAIVWHFMLTEEETQALLTRNQFPSQADFIPGCLTAISLR